MKKQKKYKLKIRVSKNFKTIKNHIIKNQKMMIKIIIIYKIKTFNKETYALPAKIFLEENYLFKLIKNK